MSDVKWIKITTDMFDNRKIKHLRRLPDGNSVVLIWVMLLTMAGRCNSGGMIFLTENIPYTTKMLADELDFEENTVCMALDALKQLNMIVTDGDFFSIAGWEEYQNIEGMDKIREQTRQRVARHRKKQKMLDCNVTETLRNATEEDKEKEKEKNIDYRCIADLFNQLCPSLPSITSLSDARKKAIKARMNTYNVDDFEKLFRKAENSSFLKGSNNRNWTANFDWLIKDANMAKVLDGNFDDKNNMSKNGNINNPKKQDLERQLLQGLMQKKGD